MSFPRVNRCEKVTGRIKELFRDAIGTKDCVECLKVIGELEFAMYNVYENEEMIRFTCDYNFGEEKRGVLFIVAGDIHATRAPTWDIFLDGETLDCSEDRIVSSECVSTAEAVMAVKVWLS